ncbi:MAG: FkbM family methyltransferase [Betaproteobacteria bacterium]
MAESRHPAAKRRAFLRGQLGTGAAFLAGLAGGAPLGAAALHVHRSARPQPWKPRHSYAQQGEDIILWHMLGEVLKRNPVTYLDIGAHHPVVNNNTYLFYEKGHRGVLVEPNPALHETLAAARPRDTLLRAGIGAGGETEADYYVISGDGQLNTFSKQAADEVHARTGGRHSVEGVIRMPLLNINEVMQKHFGRAPHLLSLDTEGFELPILRSLDFERFRPEVVCLDVLEFGTGRVRNAAVELMLEKNYAIRGATFVNAVFIDARLIP